MPINKISVDHFMELAHTCPVLDVRSPGEYLHAHLPAAHSVPLFTDEERKVVGTLYKQQSREEAIKKGLEYFGGKMVSIIEIAESICQSADKKMLVHCWRGGMRSAGVAWLLDLYGFDVYTLAGGYKAYRNWVLAQFHRDYPLQIIGGNTGSGKTAILKEMEKAGHNIIDLEGLAHHKGSAFGAINMLVQPSQEMFENSLAGALYNCQHTASPESKLIYIEDESQRIGLVNVPIALWAQMRRKPMLFLQVPFTERLQYLVKDYGKGDQEKLVNAIIRLRKRLGGLEAKTAISYLLEDNVSEAFKILLAYYDKQYSKGLASRKDQEAVCREIFADTVHPVAIVKEIISITTKEINA